MREYTEPCVLDIWLTKVILEINSRLIELKSQAEFISEHPNRFTEEEKIEFIDSVSDTTSRLKAYKIVQEYLRAGHKSFTLGDTMEKNFK